jgi:hypothetical protein
MKEKRRDLSSSKNIFYSSSVDRWVCWNLSQDFLRIDQRHEQMDYSKDYIVDRRSFHHVLNDIKRLE